MPGWGLVATVKAPEDQVLAFIAHHLSLGASRIWIYFDDPNDPAYARVSRLPRVKAVRCTDWYWAIRGGRYDNVMRRQVRNGRDAQRACRLDWLGHLDVDEFLFPSKPVAEILAEVPITVPNLMMEPFEAMHDPDAPEDIFTARHFRGPLHGQHRGLIPAIFGRSAEFLPKGSLGHTIGKSFCRPRVKGLSLDLHVVLLNKKVLETPFHPSLRLLHFHAQDPVAWTRALPFRLSKGGYNCDADRPMQTRLTDAPDEVIREFYKDIMTLTPEKTALLQANDRLIATDLGLRAKVAALLEGRL